MEKESTENTVFLIAQRRLVRETDTAFTFANKRAKTARYITIPKPKQPKSAVISITNSNIKVNNHGATRPAYRVEVRPWFGRLMDLESINEDMMDSDFNIL